MSDERPCRCHEESPDAPKEPDASLEQAREGAVRPFTPFPITPWFFESTRFPRLGFGMFWSPKVDVADRGNTIVVMAELPGVEAKDIRIFVEGNVMTIEGERQQSVEVRGERYFHRERSYGT